MLVASARWKVTSTTGRIGAVDVNFVAVVCPPGQGKLRPIAFGRLRHEGVVMQGTVLMRLGDRSFAVAEIRHRLAHLGLLSRTNGDHDCVRAACDVFDETVDHAIRAFQQQRGLRTDGVVDAETFRALDEAKWRLGDRVLSYVPGHPLVGDDVAALQRRLCDMGFDCGRCDGIFGPLTEAALREFQRNVGLPADGTCGADTLRALQRLRRTVVGGRPYELRETLRLRHHPPTIAGKCVVLDPGHGGRDTGARTGDLCEASLVDDIANRIEGRLLAVGAQPFRTRAAQHVLHPEDVPPSDADRASFANAAEADVVVSLHIDGHHDPACNGFAVYYYGTARERSVVGERLAELVRAEVLERTDFLDCRTHPKTWELLRRTRMPAVRVECGYLTNPADAERLADPRIRDHIADGIASALRRLYEDPGEPAAL